MTEKELKKWNKECSYAYFLENIPGLGKKLTDVLWKEYGSYEAIYQNAGTSLLFSKYKKLRQAFDRLQDVWDVEQKYRELRNNGIFCVPKSLEGYPPVLREFEDAPSVLYVKGRLPDEKKPLVAIIGSRDCSNYGIYVARELGKRLAYEGIGVISGMARGIDGIGQQAALEHGGATFGVLGSGVDICYPTENSTLYRRLCEGECKGGVMSELLPGTKAKSGHFPARNRIISGLADAVAVIEAKEKSGTFITVTRALEQGKDVYAVPGRLTDALSIGCLKLIEQGADVIWDLDVFIQKVKNQKAFLDSKNGFVKKMPDDKETEALSLHLPKDLTGLQKEIYDALDFRFQDVNYILCKLEKPAISTQDILAALSELECKNIVEQDGGFYRWKI